MFELLHLSVFVGRKRILHDISYRFQKNKVYVLMGPNGSGKSTLAHAVMGHPDYTLGLKSVIRYNKHEIKTLLPEKRALAGIFMSFQTPHVLNGVTVFQLLRVALQGKKDAFTLKKEIFRTAKQLHISPELVERSLNAGSSGGERKKLEVLQAAILRPGLAIFDEVDTGVDIDALKTISSFMATFKKNRTVIIITHNSRILKYISPDTVIILKEGKIVKEGGKDLLAKIETGGFEKL